MPDFIPYSEKQQILTTEQWEIERFLDQDCETAKVVSETLRAIVSRLLQIDSFGKNYDLNKFEFLLSDVAEQNAAFISSEYTRNGKHVIYVTRGIINLCKTEDELAGVLAHELGHFTYYESQGKNDNTVFQERFSDLHSLDFMLAGGYDPAAYSKVCDTMRNFGGHIGDVHGGAVSRKEDVDAYLTKLRMEHGRFETSAPTGLFDNFVKVLSNRRDKYKTYFELLLEHNFPEILINPDYKPQIDLILNLIVSELQKGNINTNQRNYDAQKCIYNACKKVKGMRDTQKVFEKILYLYGTNVNFSKFYPFSNIKDIFSRIVWDVRNNKPFKVCYPIDQYLMKIDEFMTTRDPERARELARYLWKKSEEENFHPNYIRILFGKPDRFKMPTGALAKGQTMPTEWLASVAYESDFHTRKCILGMIEGINVESQYEWLTDNDNKYRGKIIAVGKKEIEDIKHKKARQELYKENHERFQTFINLIDLLYEFDKGNISARDVALRLKQYSEHHKGGLKEWMFLRIYLIDYKTENPFLRNELKALESSEAFAEYIKTFLARLKTALSKVDPKSAKKILLDNPPAGKTWFSYLKEISSKYFVINEAYNALDFSNAIIRIIRQMGYQSDSTSKDALQWNVDVSNIVNIVSRMKAEKIYSIFVKFIKTAVKEGVYEAGSAAKLLLEYGEKVSLHDAIEPRITLKNGNKIVEIIDDLETKKGSELAENAFEDFSVVATQPAWIAAEGKYIYEVLEFEMVHKNDLHKVYRLLKTFNVVPHNEQELVNILKGLSGYWRFNQQGISKDLAQKLQRYVLTYYMRTNPPVKNICPILFAMHEGREFSNGNEKAFADELADYIETNKLLPNDFQSLYDLYAAMERLKIFSMERCNQAKIMDLLIEKIKQMPTKDKEDYSWKLLSGFYYLDNDSRWILNRKKSYVNLPLDKNKLLEIYSDAVAERLGPDNNTYEYTLKIKDLLDFINKEHAYDFYTDEGQIHIVKRPGINKFLQKDLYRLISDKIQSQQIISELLSENCNISLSDDDAQKNEILGDGVEAMLMIFERYNSICVPTIEFLNRKLTRKSIEDYRKTCRGFIPISNAEELVYNNITPAVLEEFYYTFWSSGLDIRALMMNKLLNRAFKTLDEKIKYICDLNFDKNSPYRADAEMICDCVIKSFEPYEQDLILAAIASADENKEEGQSASRSVGEGLRMFFENMGPAWVKFGQLLSYVPDLPSEIRRDLGKLKDKADIPARWDVYKWMHEAMPQDLYNRIEKVEEIVGAGSFWMTAVIQIRNDKGELEKKVIQLLRPEADKRADDGFEIIERAIRKLSKRKDSYKILLNVARQARESAKYEVDVEVGNKQYEKAKELYGDIQVNVEGIQYTPHVADWRYYGTGKNGMSYKIMDYAQGATLSRVYASDDERRKMALAYFTIEMVNLFKGDVWDIDRHQGQQNFDITSPTNVSINIYDTGAQLPKAPNKKNKILLANIFFDLVQEVQAGKSIDSYLLKVIKRLDKLQNTLHIDVSYVSNVQKGLMALSDIIEYQKEIKDADGNIIQKRLTLSAEDLKHAIVAVLQNPSVDEHMSVVIKSRVVAAKLKHLDVQSLKELLQNSGDTSDNPVKIDITEKTYERLSAKLNKALEEIEALDDPDGSIMGIPKQYIDSKAAKPPMGSFDNFQKVA